MDSIDSAPRNDNKTITLNGKQLAEALNVAAPSLSEAVRKGYRCGGYPVGDWAAQSDSGRITSYQVPAQIVSEDIPSGPTRTNPEKEPSEDISIIPNTNKKRGQKSPAPENAPAEHLPGVTNNTYSLLPEGQNYAQPVGMVALATTLKTALQEDTSQSRAVIGSLLAMLGAFTGHAVSDHSAGAGIGAVAGLGIAFGAYRYLSPNATPKPQTTPQVRSATTIQNVKRVQKPARSTFLAN